MSPLTTFGLELLALLLPLVALSWFWRIYPHRALVLLALVPAALSIALAAAPVLLAPLLIADGLVLALAAADLALVPRWRSFRVERLAGRIASLDKPHRVTLTLSSFAARPLTLTMRDAVPEPLAPQPAEFTLRLEPRRRASLVYQLRPTRRGAFEIPSTFVRVRSRLGLWQRTLTYPHATRVHVYPDMKQLSEYALLARTNRLSLMGVRRTRRIGEDNEFERLRDYQRDDNYRHIDWRSTARRRKLTVRQFQREQSQHLVFLIDCGRMMTNEAAGRSLLDHALNAMLMLSYVALSHGDAVGLVSFSDEVHSFVPPRGGLKHMNRLLHASFDRFPRLVESRYDQAFLYLGAHVRRRSLVVLVANLIDEVNAHQIEQYLGTLVGRHLPLGVLLRDRRLFEAVDVLEPQGQQLYRAAAAAEIISWRQQVLADLTSRGVLSLDVFPEELTAPLVNRYLEIKARHLL